MSLNHLLFLSFLHPPFYVWQVYGMHLWSKERGARKQQLTLDDWRMGAFVEFSRSSVGFCAPGHALIRHFFLAVYHAGADYKLSWRQQNVPVNIGAVDATMKRGSALTDLKIRQTLWSNDANAPLIATVASAPCILCGGWQREQQR